MNAGFYEAIGLPEPATVEQVTIAVSPAELPVLRGRVLAAGARLQQESSTSLTFRDPRGTRVVLEAAP